MTSAYWRKKATPAALAAGMTALSVAAFLALPALAGAAVTSTVAADKLAVVSAGDSVDIGCSGVGGNVTVNGADPDSGPAPCMGIKEIEVTDPTDSEDDFDLTGVRIADPGGFFVFGRLSDVILDGGEGADTILGSEAQDTIQGGPGGDLLAGGDSSDQLAGGAGEDVLRGEAGSDALRGGVSDDLLNGGEGNDEVIWSEGDGSDEAVGAAGIDTLEVTGSPINGDDFVIAPGPVTTLERTNLEPFAISLPGGNIGGFEIASIALGGGDDSLNADGPITGLGDLAEFIFDIEADGGSGADVLNGGDGGHHDFLLGGEGDDLIHGGENDDLLAGEGGDDRLLGDPGNDIVEGETGADQITGGEGIDLLAGDAGPDRIASRDAVGDTVNCGTEVDEVTADAADAVNADCESVNPPESESGGGGSQDPRVVLDPPKVTPDTKAPQVTVVKRSLRAKKGVVRLGLHCPADEHSCAVAVQLRQNAAVAGRAAVTIGGGQIGVARIRLTARATGLLARLRRVSVKAVLTATDAAGNRGKTTAAVKLLQR